MKKKKKAIKSIKRRCTIIKTMPTMIIGAASGTGDFYSTLCSTSEYHITDSFPWYNFLYYDGYTGEAEYGNPTKLNIMHNIALQYSEYKYRIIT